MRTTNPRLGDQNQEEIGEGGGGFQADIIKKSEDEIKK